MTQLATIRYTTTGSPVGDLVIVADDVGVRAIYLPSQRGSDAPRAGWREDRAGLRSESNQLRAYFAGELRDFEMSLNPQGTEFQQRVWRALLSIPFGTTTSYGELAHGLGAPAASRAVGSANGRNPISIVVPCHRVIGKDGSLTGYGGGIPVKQWLLEHEARHAGAATLF